MTDNNPRADDPNYTVALMLAKALYAEGVFVNHLNCWDDDGVFALDEEHLIEGSVSLTKLAATVLERFEARQANEWTHAKRLEGTGAATATKVIAYDAVGPIQADMSGPAVTILPRDASPSQFEIRADRLPIIIHGPKDGDGQ